MAWNHCVHGWAAAHLGQTAEGLAELESGIDASKKIMGEIAMPHFISMLAEVLILRCDYTRALDEVQRILKRNETSRDRYFNEELYRLAAECQLALGDAGAAEASLDHAIATARAQGAARLELRAAAAMAMLWAGRSEQGRARAILQAACSQLRDTENTADVRRARSLLAELA